MPKAPKADSSRKPPLPSDSHAVIDEWMQGVMPGLRPLVERLDEMIRDGLPQPQQYALKWKKAYYGVPDRGWVVELVAYDVSVNVVFFGGADFTDPPELGSGRSRYVKVRSVEELEQSELAAWIEQAGRTAGWK